MENENKMVQNYKRIALTTLVYSMFFTFCLYRNLTGITFPLFILGNYCYFIICMKTMELPFKKDTISIFQIVCSTLLGISTFMTVNWVIQFFNFMGFLLLLGSFLLHQVYEDGRWGFIKQLVSLCYTGICSIAHILDPVIDCSAYIKKQREQNDAGEKKEHKGKYVIYGVLILIPLLAVVLALLSSADIIFSNMLSGLFRNITVPDYVLGIVFLTVFAFVAAYSCLAAVMSRPVSEQTRDYRHGEPVMAITVTSVLAVVYLVFCLIQIVYLFGGMMELPEGYTYAGYARQGFFQLLFVCMLNLLLVLVCLSCFRADKVLRLILTVISGCTFVMIASSAYRMLLYIDVYLLTFLRVLVLWCLLLLTILLAGIFIYIFREDFPMFRYCMLVVTIMYLGLSFSHQDYWIARYNINAVLTESAGVEDARLYYLDELSGDAIPALAELSNLKKKLPGDARAYMPDREIIQADYGNMTIRSFNLSKWIALHYSDQF